jgi:mannose-1-phosphate guanylyltransferase/mannose-6-phosphate isomerase
MYPKQLLRLNGELTLLQQTALRLEGMPNLAEECLVVCNESHRFLVAEQLREIGVPARIVLEPEGRNTAPAVALAALLAAETAPDAGYGLAGDARRSRNRRHKGFSGRRAGRGSSGRG